MLEVIATCIDDVVKIVAGGGQRIELVSGLAEGGVTPSKGLVGRAVREAASIPVMAMIRPHAQSFVYSRADLEIMREDLETVLECGAAGVVLGALTPEKEVDRRALDYLLAVDLKGRSVTFHKALDQAADLERAFAELQGYPIDRVLTAGGQGAIMSNLERLKRLVQAGKGKIKVLAGGGVRLDNAAAIMNSAGIEEIHVGTAVRKSASCTQPVEPLLVRRFLDICGEN